MNDLVWNGTVIPTLLFVWGLLVKYWPILAKVPNFVIPWVNILLAALIRIASPDAAEAADKGILSSISHAFGWLWVPLQPILAAQIYERFFRPWMDAMGISKAEVKKHRKTSH